MNSLCETIGNLVVYPSSFLSTKSIQTIPSSATTYRPLVLPSINTMLKAIENEDSTKMESPLNSLRTRLPSSCSPTRREETHPNINLKKIIQKDIFQTMEIIKTNKATPILWELKKSNLEEIPGKNHITLCQRKKCNRVAKKDNIYCKWHVDSRICRVTYCEKSSKTGGYCIAHGGGKRCQFPGGCYKSAKQGDLCIAHGGGIRCTITNCTKAAVKRGLCVAHGGGRKCKIPGCHKNSVRADLCAGHGGRRRSTMNTNYKNRQFLMQQLLNI